MIRGHCSVAVSRSPPRATCASPTPPGSSASSAKVGIVYPPASIRPLIDLVGPATAKYLLLSGESIDADTALRTGLVDRLVASDQLEAEVFRFAEVLASRSALTQRSVKEIVAALTDGRDGDAESRAAASTARPSPAASSRRVSPRSPSVRRSSAEQTEQDVPFRIVHNRGSTDCGAPPGGRTGAAPSA